MADVLTPDEFVETLRAAPKRLQAGVRTRAEAMAGEGLEVAQQRADDVFDSKTGLLAASIRTEVTVSGPTLTVATRAGGGSVDYGRPVEVWAREQEGEGFVFGGHRKVVEMAPEALAGLLDEVF